jgi:hypothetical protein
VAELKRAEVQAALEAAYHVLYAMKGSAAYPTLWQEGGPGYKALTQVEDVLQRWPRKES